MIDYHTFCELHRLCEADGLSLAQTARILNLDERTVAKWTSTETYQPRATVVRPSKLDPYRATSSAGCISTPTVRSSSSNGFGRLVTRAVTPS